MTLVVNFADKEYRKAQRVCSACAKRFGADKVLEYSPKDLGQEYREKCKDVRGFERGNGYWSWKPYVIYDALKKVDDGDYVFYIDSGAALIEPLQQLIDCMERDGTDVMCFSLSYPEKVRTKRDAFILMGTDSSEYTDTPQISATYILLKKTPYSLNVIEEYMKYVGDARIISDQYNVMGYGNYDGFVENRHDQSVWSLLCKKHSIHPYRDPSQHGTDKNYFSNEVNARSTYPQMINSYRDKYICSPVEVKEARRWYDYLNVYLISLLLIKKLKLFAKKALRYGESCE